MPLASRARRLPPGGSEARACASGTAAAAAALAVIACGSETEGEQVVCVGAGCAGSGQVGEGLGDASCGSEVRIRFEETALPGSAQAPAQVHDCVVLQDIDADGRVDLLTKTGSAAFGEMQEAEVEVRWGGAQGFGEVTVLSVDGAESNYWGGCAVADLDGDGMRDLLVHALTPPRAWRQTGPRAFEAVGWLEGLVDPRAVEQDGLSRAARGFGVTEIDGDGLPDVYLGRAPNEAPFGTGGGEVTAECDVGECDVQCWQCDTEQSRDRCVRAEVVVDTDQVHLGAGEGRLRLASMGIDQTGYILTLAIADVNRDGQPDLLAGNDFGPDPLFVSQPDGGYLEESVARGIVAYNHAMGAVFADLNHDEWWDLYVADAGPHQLYFGEPEGRFRNVACDNGVAELSADTFGWGVVAEDFDNDGDTDLFVANSVVCDPGQVWHVAEVTTPENIMQYCSNAEQADFVIENCGDGTFRYGRVAPAADFLAFVWWMPVAAADLDGDGRVDLAENYFADGPSQKLRVLRNVTDPVGRHLRVELRGRAPNSDGLGAEIRVRAGGVAQLRQVQVASTGGHGPTAQHVGLGDATSAEVEVRWRSGAVTRATGTAGATVVVRE